jgi:hypothetical protein
MHGFSELSTKTAFDKAFIVADDFAFVRRERDDTPYLYVQDLQDSTHIAVYARDGEDQLNCLDSTFSQNSQRASELNLYLTEGKRFMLQGLLIST